MDAVYAVSPFWNALTKPGQPVSDVFQSPYHASNRSASGMPDPEDLLDRYSQIVGFDPRQEGSGRDWEVAKIFHYVRGGTISHGIQARTISGQASSDFSHVYFENTRRSMDAAWEMVQALKEKETERSRL